MIEISHNPDQTDNNFPENKKQMKTFFSFYFPVAMYLIEGTQD